MKNIKVFILILLLLFGIPLMSAEAADLRNSVVKIFTTTNTVDYYSPWQSKGSQPSIGSGCIIDGKRILTNAHVVTDQTFIQVKKHSDPKKYTAKLEAIGHDCDLAILSVTDETFFEGMMSLEMGQLPKLKDVVNVLGFPRGGDKISVTQGVVSRTEVTRYSHSLRYLLTSQIDAAINPGNSGGPVIQDGKLVGIAMQIVQNSQNIGYIIPPPIIKHFLEDLSDEKYDGFPKLGIEFSTTENSALREYYKIKDKPGGIQVTRVYPYSPSDGYLKKRDVILSIDDVPIGEDGTFLFRDSERLIMVHLISQHQASDEIKFQVIRDGEEIAVKFPLSSFESVVPSPYFFKNKPPYIIFGGLVFTVLSSDLIGEWGGSSWCDAPISFKYKFFGSGRLNYDGKKEMVVLLNVLPDDLNVGHHNDVNMIISKVNGREFASFKEFVLEMHKKQGPYTIIETEDNYQMILDNVKIEEKNLEIIKRNNIAAPYSEEVGEWLDE